LRIALALFYEQCALLLSRLDLLLAWSPALIVSTFRPSFIIQMADALDAQRKYALLPHASACERTNLLNQMMISWTPSEIIGVFYVKDEEKKFAHRMLRITEAQRSNWVERQAKALATRTLRSPVAAPWTPSLPRHPLQLCQLPTPATQWWFAINRTKAGRGVEARGRALGGPVDDIQRSTASSPNAA